MSLLDERLADGLDLLASSAPVASGDLEGVKRLGRRRLIASRIAAGVGVLLLVAVTVGPIAVLRSWGSSSDSPAESVTSSVPATPTTVVEGTPPASITATTIADAEETVDSATVAGLAWIRVDLSEDPDRDPEDEAYGARGVAYANGRFVASGPGGIWHSDDLVTWTEVTPASVEAPDDTEDNPNDASVDASGPLAGGPLGFVASIGQGEERGHTAVLFSEDGVTWTRIGIRDPEAWDLVEITDISAGGPGWVAVGRHGRDGRMWVSADGLTWETITLPDFAGVWLIDVSEQDGQLTVIGKPAEGTSGAEITTLIWVSDDGLTWEPVPLQEEAIGPATHSIAVNPDTGRHVALNSQGVWISDDGVEWREATSDNGAPPYTHPTDNAVWLGDIILGTHRYQDALFESADGGVTWVRTPWPRSGLFVHDDVVIATAGDLWIGTLE